MRLSCWLLAKPLNFLGLWKPRPRLRKSTRWELCLSNKLFIYVCLFVYIRLSLSPSQSLLIFLVCLPYVCLSVCKTYQYVYLFLVWLCLWLSVYLCLCVLFRIFSINFIAHRHFYFLRLFAKKLLHGTRIGTCLRTFAKSRTCSERRGSGMP